MQFGNSSKSVSKHTLFFSFLLLFQLSFSQSIDDTIYNTVDEFNANPKATTYLKLLEQETEFKKQLKTKNDYLAFVHLLCNKGYYLKTKIPKDAISAYENAWSLFQEQNLPLSHYDMIENCLKPLGNLYTKSKNYTNAENTITQYISIAKRIENYNHEVAGIINLSKLYQSLGKHNDVLSLVKPYISKTTNKQQLDKLKRIEQYSLAALGKSNSKVLIIDRVIVPNIHKDNAYLNYTTALKNNDYKEAFKAFNYYQSDFLKTDYTIRNLVKLYLQEAQLFLLSETIENHLSKTKNTLDKALNILLPNDKVGIETLYAEPLLIDIFDIYSQIQTNEDEALKYVDFSLHVSSLIQESLVDNESKLINLNDTRKLSEKAISISYDAYQKTKNSGYISRAFIYAENSRAYLLKEKNTLKNLLQQYPSDSLLINQQQLKQQQNILISDILSTRKTTANSNIILTKQLQLSDINLQLKNNTTIIKNSYGANVNKISIPQIQQKLDSNSVLVEYFYGKHAIYQFIITKNKIEIHKLLLNEDAQNTISTFIGFFNESSRINNDIEGFKKNASDLYKLLNIEAVKAFENLTIIPDGLLNFVSFEALQTENSSTNIFQNMPFLLLRHTVTYNNSALFYQNSSSQNIDFNVLGVFPIFKGSKQELTYTETEASEIEKKHKGLFLLHDKATKQAFLSESNNFNILHISTHASSGDFFIPASIDFIDSSLDIEELESINFNPNLVVLSACETGIGKLRKGEGAMSISRGFQSAGANNVLFSLWNVNDLSTASIMSNIYNSIEKNSVAKANKLSKVNYLNNDEISNSKKSPYYWASFVYYGENELYKKEGQSYFIYLIIVFLTLLIYILYGRKFATISYKK